MKKNKLQKLKNQYEETPIPVELDEVIEKSLQRNNKKRWQPKWFIGTAAAAMILFTAGINSSPTFAKNIAQIPILSSVVEVLSFTKFEVKDGNHEASIEVPKITGDSEEIKALNAQYEAEGRALYDQYLDFAEEMDDKGHYGIDSGYVVFTENEQLLSFGRYVVEMVGSSSTTMKYTTIDKQQQIAITLQSLFKDNSYISIINQYIEQKMREEIVESNQEKMYWVRDGEGVEEDLIEVFETIKEDQNFYITEQGKLVIAFDKYEVAPGYMGLVEFEIPTELLSDVLVSNEYIK
ncbi:DUF3298 domain-containing protein [Solibacillus sp. FSL R7-0682]|uniref:DUF3298 domain-containing protein n=1 Tax=Solibacillus sp. FSL R7-0682 TaxID=2921690 RepID=UPI0030F6812C